MSMLKNALSIAFVGSLMLMVNSNAGAKEKVLTASEAITCVPNSSTNKYKGNCPYPSDVVKVDATFKRVYNEILKNKEIASINGPESPFSPVELDGKKYLFANFCQQHMCSEIRFDYLYLPSQSKIVGIYRDESDTPEKKIWVGNPNENEKAALRKLMP